MFLLSIYFYSYITRINLVFDMLRTYKTKWEINLYWPEDKILCIKWLFFVFRLLCSVTCRYQSSWFPTLNGCICFNLGPWHPPDGKVCSGGQSTTRLVPTSSSHHRFRVNSSLIPLFFISQCCYCCLACASWKSFM